MFNLMNKSVMVSPEAALPGREQKMFVPHQHYVHGREMLGEDGLLFLPEGFQRGMFGLGCFWGAERKFWQQQGVYLTAVGYAAGFTENPNYEEVCTGKTGHNEVVAVVFDPVVVSYDELLVLFWEGHNPTQGMRQGNDTGTQYRSGIYTDSDEHMALAQYSMQSYSKKLAANGYDAMTTEVIAAPVFYFAEEYHQQYLAKNPGGYCGLGGTGIACDSDFKNN